MGNSYTVYTADLNRRSMGQILGSMLSGVLSSRYLSYRLCLKDIKSDYSKSAFGMLWDLIDPLMLALVFYFLVSVRVVSTGEIQIPYAVFVIHGILLFQTFVDAVLLPLDVTKRSRNLITQLRVSPEALILATFFRILFNSFFRILIILGFSLALGAFSLSGFAKFLLLFPSLILAGMAFGVLLAPFNAIYNDVGRATRIALTPLRFASPVLYAIPTVPPFSYLYSVNPVAAILSNLRSLATEDLFLDPEGFALRVVGLAATFLVGWFVFHVSMPVLAERI